jgi:hypothetical protein
MCCTLLSFIYLGMMVVALTPNSQVATITALMCFIIQNLMARFVVYGQVRSNADHILYFIIGPYYIVIFLQYAGELLIISLIEEENSTNKVTPTPKNSL